MNVYFTEINYYRNCCEEAENNNIYLFAFGDIGFRDTISLEYKQRRKSIRDYLIKEYPSIIFESNDLNAVSGASHTFYFTDPADDACMQLKISCRESFNLDIGE